MKFFFNSILAFLIVFSLFSCSKVADMANSTAPDVSGSGTIVADSGGTVAYNNEVALVVPAGSLAADTTIKIEKISDTPAGASDGMSGFGAAYKFSPGGTVFASDNPARLEISYDLTALEAKGLSPRTLQLYYFDEELGRYVSVPTSVDESRKKITALIEHFTVYVPVAKSMIVGNNAPYVALLNPVPNPVRAGAPIYVRATARDWDSGGSITGVKLYYRKLQPAPSAWENVYMTKEVIPNSMDVYGYLIPSTYLTSGDLGTGNDIEWYVEATDNLGAASTTTSMSLNVTRTYIAGSLIINPGSQTITAGFETYFSARGTDSLGTNFTLLPETVSISQSDACTITNHYTLGRLIRAKKVTVPNPAMLTFGFGTQSAASTISVHNGELDSIAILDRFSQPITGDVVINENDIYNFDAIGYDAYGNTVYIYPTWNASPSIGTINNDGLLNTTGTRGTGQITVALGKFSVSQNVTVLGDAKDITSFSINGVNGVINNNIITVILPSSVNVADLVATFATTGKEARISENLQNSGTTSNSFKEPVTYRVYAQNNTWKDYKVIVAKQSWARTYGGSGDDGSINTAKSSNIQMTIDGGYIMATVSTSSINGDVTGTNHGGQDVWVIKVDVGGHIEWQRLFGGSGTDAASSIKATSDGGYIFAGYTTSNNGDVLGNHSVMERDFWVVKIDNLGVIQWQKCLGGTGEDTAYSMELTVDGGYIVAGTTLSNNSGDVSGNHGGYDFLVVKLNSLGDIQWQKCLGGSSNDHAYSIKQTFDGGYIIIGLTGSSDGNITGFHGGTYDVWVVKIDGQGNLQWQRALGGSGNDYGNSIIQTSDGGYILAGETYSSNIDVLVGGSSFHGGSDAWIVKLDSTGVIEWQKCLGGSDFDYAYSIQQTSDDGYIVGMTTSSIDGDVSGLIKRGGYDSLIVKLNSVGTIEWKKCLGGSGYDIMSSIQQTSDGGYIISGSTDSNDYSVSGNHGGYDLWIIKLDSSGNL